MSALKPQRPRTRAALLPQRTEDVAATQRAVEGVKRKLEDVDASGVLNRQVIIANLVLGLNTINHALGRAVRGYTLTLTNPGDGTVIVVHALVSAGNAHPEQQVWIKLLGLAQPGATLEIF